MAYGQNKQERVTSREVSTDGSLYAEWGTTYEKLQFWLGVYRKAPEDANGDKTHHKVQFARTKLDAAQARYDAVVSRL